MYGKYENTKYDYSTNMVPYMMDTRYNHYCNLKPQRVTKPYAKREVETNHMDRWKYTKVKQY